MPQFHVTLLQTVIMAQALCAGAGIHPWNMSCLSRDQIWAKSSNRWKNKSSSFSSTGPNPSQSNFRYWAADLSKRGQCINSTVRSSIRYRNTGGSDKNMVENVLRILEGRNFHLYYWREKKILNLNIKHSFQYLCFVIQSRLMEICLFIESWGELGTK